MSKICLIVCQNSMARIHCIAGYACGWRLSRGCMLEAHGWMWGACARAVPIPPIVHRHSLCRWSQECRATQGAQSATCSWKAMPCLKSRWKLERGWLPVTGTTPIRGLSTKGAQNVVGALRWELLIKMDGREVNQFGFQRSSCYTLQNKSGRIWERALLHWLGRFRNNEEVTVGNTRCSWSQGCCTH